MVPVILAGGSGTRLWPLSRQLYPKQLIRLIDHNSMLQNTFLRIADFDGVHGPVVVCNEAHRFMTAEQMRKTGTETGAIILEPQGRNTAPAIAAAATIVRQQYDDPIMLVLPADHIIDRVSRFHEAVQKGRRFAQEGGLVLFGVVPRSPETGYGYIKKGAPLAGEADVFAIDRFVEKPGHENAEKYMRSGQYCWNSGMFMFKSSVILDQLAFYDEQMVACCTKSVENGRQDLDFFRLESDSFRKAAAESIDYKVMEKTDKGVMVSCDIGWDDLGSFEALWQTGEKDGNRNVIRGDVLTSDVTNSYIHASDRLVAAVGVEDHIIVETKDAVLVTARGKVQEVKNIVEKLNSRDRYESVSHPKVYRPWGSYETIDAEERFKVKRITVKPGAKLSLQKHFHRAEHWTVVSGAALITKDGKQFLLKEDESAYIPVGLKHRLENPGKIPLELIEVQSGSYLGEDDIVRFDDIYGRENN